MSFDIYRIRVCGAALLSLAIISCGGGSSNDTTPVTATPTFSVAGGPYTSAQSVSLADSTSGAIIYYTLNGTTPTSTVSATNFQYSSAITVGASTIIEAIAVAPSHSASTVAGAAYTIGPAAAAAGIWVGNDSEATAEEVLGFVTATGESIFIRGGANNNDVVFTGSATVTSGTAFSIAALDGATNFPYAFPNSSTSGTGSLSFALDAQVSLNGPLTFSAGGTPYDSTWTFQYSTISLIGSSVPAIAGSYTDPNTGSNSTTADALTGATITLSSAGVITSSGATSGCTLGGGTPSTISTGDITTNLYEVSLTFSGCTGTWVDLNGVTFTGLAVYNNSISPAQIVLGATGLGGGASPYGLVLAFNAAS